MSRPAFHRLLFICPLWLAGCSGPQSALDPAGEAAEKIAGLFWWMTGGAAAVWLGVAALAVYAVRARPDEAEARRAQWLIVGGGAVVPTVILAVLLVFGLAMLPPLVARAPEGSRQIEVSAEQWWWRVRYRMPGGETVEMANELRLPAGEIVEFILSSPDVIHSFWIPALGGNESFGYLSRDFMGENARPRGVSGASTRISFSPRSESSS